MTLISIFLFLFSAQAEESRFMRGVNQCLEGTSGFLSTKQGVVFCSQPNTITVIHENTAGLLRSQTYALKGEELKANTLTLAQPPYSLLNIGAQFGTENCELKLAQEKGLKISAQGSQLTAEAVERLALRMKGELLNKTSGAILSSADTRAWFRGCLANLKFVVEKFKLDNVLSAAEEIKLRELVLPSNPGPKPTAPAGALRD